VLSYKPSISLTNLPKSLKYTETLNLPQLFAQALNLPLQLQLFTEKSNKTEFHFYCYLLVSSIKHHVS